MRNQQQIEEGIIGTLIMCHDYYEPFDKYLDSSMFNNGECAFIFKNMKKRFDSKRVWDIEILKSDIPAAADYLHEVFMKSVGYLEFLEYVKVLQLRSFIKDIRKVTEDPSMIDISEVQELVNDFHVADANFVKREFEEILNDAIKEAVDAGVKEHEMPYHYRALTNMTKGAMRQNVHLIVAETGHSKTVFAWNLILRPLEMGFKVIVYDYEMPDVSMVVRGVAMKYRIPIDWMDKGRYHLGQYRKITEADRTLAIQKMQEFGKEFKDNLIIRSNFTIDQMEKDIAENKPDIVLVDTIQAFCSMHPIKGSKTKADHITDLCQLLEGFTKKYNLAMFQTAQVNRQNDGSIPRPSTIKESGGIAEKAGTIFGVRDKYKASKDDKDRGVFDLEITKARHGQMGYIGFQMNPAIAYISEGLKTLSIEEERKFNEELPEL